MSDNETGVVPPLLFSSKAVPDYVTKEFISAYRQQRLLWDTGHHHYGNKRKRAEAYEALVPILKKSIPVADQTSVRKHINSIRSTFKPLLLKHLRSKTVINGKVVYKYVPSSWKFQALKFLCNEITVMDTPEVPSDIDTSVTEEKYQDMKEESDREYYSDDDVLNDSVSGDTPARTQRALGHMMHFDPQKCPKQPQLEFITTEDQFSEIGRVSGTVEISDETPVGEYKAIGMNLAFKLHRMNVDQRYLAELLINKVLSKGLKNKLNDETDLSGLSQVIENNEDYDFED